MLFGVISPLNLSSPDSSVASSSSVGAFITSSACGIDDTGVKASDTLSYSSPVITPDIMFASRSEYPITSLR